MVALEINNRNCHIFTLAVDFKTFIQILMAVLVLGFPGPQPVFAVAASGSDNACCCIRRARFANASLTPLSRARPLRACPGAIPQQAFPPGPPKRRLYESTWFLLLSLLSERGSWFHYRRFIAGD